MYKLYEKVKSPKPYSKDVWILDQSNVILMLIVMWIKGFSSHVLRA